MLLLASCGGIQSSNGRDGTQSALIGGLFDIFLWTAVAVYVGVMIYLGVALIRGRRHRRAEGGLQGEPSRGTEAGWRVALIAFAGATAVILAGLSAATWFTDRSLARAAEKPAMEIELIGHQWWWEVRYRAATSSLIVRTANELHLPVGRTTRILLKSDDVIHSMWIPNLAGKQDLIPGRDTDLTLHPLRAGLFRAQCAEFCGMQHARMALDVTVDTDADFARWYAAQMKAPAPPTGGPALAGYRLFQTRQCASCHAVAGTPASGSVAPDLSHVASRRTIAAGTLRISHANMMRWIEDPQGPKPGNNMPKVPLTPAELGALTAYMETLR
ncbi:MAG TPA: c-type cytochrome [Sphingobium sp.]|nr:c-type cytochrome [Sphingobium sp.]